jgi:hypothetical protein
MKILLNKKTTIVLSIVVLFTSITKAQIPEKLKNSPPFKMHALMVKPSNKPHALHQLNDIRHNNNYAPCLKVQTTLGGSNYDAGLKITRTSDGGFIACGITNSNDDGFHVPASNGPDAFVARYNKYSQLVWLKTFGGTGYDSFNDIVQTYDGGYIALGQSGSNDGDVSGNHGGIDVWAVKLNSSGNIEWQKCFGGSGDDFGDAVVQTFYGGYAITGFTNSNDGNIQGNHNTDGNFDAWFIQINAKGNLLSQHCYGGSDFDGLFAMVQADFGSFILEGQTFSNDGDVSGNHGGGDVWVIKINAIGKIVWQRAVGGSGYDNGASNEIATTTDGNVVINGYSTSPDGDINGQNDSSVSFITKLNAYTGKIIWSKSYAEPSLRAGSGIFATKDGGIVETGVVSANFDMATFDALISKFDKNGNEEWVKSFGGSDYDGAIDGYETTNGDLNILCQTISIDGDVKNNHGAEDTWIIKLGRCGEKLDDEKSVTTNERLEVTKNNTATNNSAIKLYPNPAKDAIKIEGLNASAKTTLSLFNVSGKLVQQSTAIGETYIFNLENLAAGSYYITIKSDKEITTLKFVKE